MRAYGFQGDYRSKYVGLNGKISELNAALGVLSMRQIDDLLKRRLDIVAGYRSALGDLVGWQRIADGDVSTYKDLAIGLGSSRTSVEAALADAGVQSKRYFVPLHTMDPYAAFSRSPKPATDKVHESSLCVPLFPDMTDRELDLIVNTIRKALA
jgi:dTDP-4-amino-4,6-dideoxygalactose transaminase